MVVRMLLMAAVLEMAGYTQVGGETLFKFGEERYGAYAGPVLKFSQVNGEAGVLLGGKMAMTFNSAFSVGGEGYWLVPGPNADYPDTARLRMGVMGLVLEGTAWPKKIAHGIIFGFDRNSRSRDAQRIKRWDGNAHGLFRRGCPLCDGTGIGRGTQHGSFIPDLPWPQLPLAFGQF